MNAQRTAQSLNPANSIRRTGTHFQHKTTAADRALEFLIFIDIENGSIIGHYADYHISPGNHVLHGRREYGPVPYCLFRSRCVFMHHDAHFMTSLQKIDGHGQSHAAQSEKRHDGHNASYSMPMAAHQAMPAVARKMTLMTNLMVMMDAKSFTRMSPSEKATRYTAVSYGNHS